MPDCPLEQRLRRGPERVTPRWETIFHIGGLLPVLVLPALALFLTESVAAGCAGHLLIRQPRRLARARPAAVGPVAVARLLFRDAGLLPDAELDADVAELARLRPALTSRCSKPRSTSAGSVAVMIASSALDGPCKTPLAISALPAHLVAWVCLGLDAADYAGVFLCCRRARPELLTSQSILCAVPRRRSRLTRCVGRARHGRRRRTDGICRGAGYSRRSRPLVQACFPRSRLSL